MTCEQVQKLLDAYVDGELDLVHNLEIEEHLQDCGPCQISYQNQLTLKKALKQETLYYALPAGLQKNIQTSLSRAVSKQPVPLSRLSSRRWVRSAGLIAAGLVVLLVGGLLLLANIFSSSPSGKNELLAQEVVASHVRSLMVGHLEDVASTDQHTVKPWFDGKLDFSPTVEDFAEKGYPLIGGRLDYLDKQPVAALVYQRNKHIINLFIWPAHSSLKTDAQTETLQGYHLFYWSKAGWNYWAVSDLNTSELEDFVQLTQTAVGS